METAESSQADVSRYKGPLLALIAFGIFSTHDVFIKILGGAYSPIQIVFFSVLFSFPLAALFLLRDQTEGTLLPRHPYWMAARTIAAVITGFSAFYAFSVLPLAQTYAIIFAAPLLITILAIPILGERVRIRRWLAVIVGLVGVIVVLRPGQVPLELGHLAALAAAICGAFASIVVRKIGREERSVVIMLYPMMANFFIMGALLPTVYVPMPMIDLAYVALVAAFAWIAGRFLIAAYTAGEAATVAPMQYSQILWAAAFGYLFFEESPSQNTIIGAGIIIASGLYIVLRESRSGPTGTTPVLRTRSRAETGTTPRVGPILWRRAPPK